MGFNQHEYQGNEHSIKNFSNAGERETIQSNEGIIAKGERKFESLKNNVPQSVKTRSNEAIEWAKANPYKAATFGLLGIMSLKSSLVRRLSRTAITIAASAFIKKKLDDSNINL